MVTLNTQRISRRTVEAFPVGEREALYWDSELSGFGIRVYPSESKVYLVQMRKGGRSRRLTVERHGLISPDRVRTEAARIIADIKAGRKPLPANGAVPVETGPTVAEVAKRYMREYVEVRCKPTTVRYCRHALDHTFCLRRVQSLSGRSGVSGPRLCTTACTRHRSQRTRLLTCSRACFTCPKTGDCPGGRQSMQVHTEILRSAVASVSSPRRRAGISGVCWARLTPKARCVQARWRPFRLPAQRDPDAALGRCGTRGGRDSTSRCEAGARSMVLLPAARARACRKTAPDGQSLG